MKFRLRINPRILSYGAIAMIFFSLGSCKEKKESDKPTLPPPVKVKVLAVEDENINNSRLYSGTVSSANSTTVSFSVPGTISNLYASEGQHVGKGQLLGKVRSGEYENARNIAHAQLAEAQDGYERLKKLHDANALPDVKWVEMEQKLKQAQNAAEMADRTLADAAIYSPVSGTVSRKFADVGQTVISVQPIYEIISTDALNIEVPVSENEIGGFSIGMKAHITFESPDIPPMDGRIVQKSVTADPLTRSFAVKIGIGSDHGKILPGMIANVKFETGKEVSEESSVILLPSRAVQLNEDNRLFVWIVSKGVAERRFVNADELAANGVIIKTGLTPGDSVIIDGMQKVGTGTRVIAVTN